MIKVTFEKHRILRHKLEDFLDKKGYILYGGIIVKIRKGMTSFQKIFSVPIAQGLVLQDNITLYTDKNNISKLRELFEEFQKDNELNIVIGVEEELR